MFARLCTLVLLAVLLSACGGGGSGDAAPGTPAPEQPPPATPEPPAPPLLQGQVLQLGHADLLGNAVRGVFYTFQEGGPSAGAVLEIDAATGAARPLLAPGSLPAAPLHPFFGGPQGLFSLTADRQTLLVNLGGELARIDLRTASVQQRIALGLAPDGPSLAVLEPDVPTGTGLTAKSIRVHPANPDLLLVASQAAHSFARFTIRQLYVNGVPRPGLFADHARDNVHMIFAPSDQSVILDSDAPFAAMRKYRFDPVNGISNVVETSGEAGLPLNRAAQFLGEELLTGNRLFQARVLFARLTVPGAAECTPLGEPGRVACYGPANPGAPHTLFIYDLAAASVVSAWTATAPVPDTFNGFGPRHAPVAIRFGGPGVVAVSYQETNRAGPAGTSVIALFRDAAFR